MKLLLDTHAFLWWLTDSPRLSAPAAAAIAEAETLFVSTVTAWEIATKHRLGKLPEAEPIVSGLAGVLERAGMTPLPLGFNHGLRAGSYPATHGDPFDRMLAAQSEIERLPLVSCDPAFRHFPVRILW